MDPRPPLPCGQPMEAPAPTRSGAAGGEGGAGETAPGPRADASGRELTLPNLIVIGAQKCGTSGLHYYLSLHPEVSMSSPKELNYFIAARNYPRGLEWYSRHFDPAARCRGVRCRRCRTRAGPCWCKGWTCMCRLRMNCCGAFASCPMRGWTT